jgi:hypothetical protein
MYVAQTTNYFPLAYSRDSSESDKRPGATGDAVTEQERRVEHQRHPDPLRFSLLAMY